MKNHPPKIDFRSQALSHPKLLSHIEHWVHSMNPQVLYHRLAFKYFPRFVTTLNPAFTCNALLYSIEKRFPSLVGTPSDPTLLQLSQTLKEQYTLINFAGMLKEDSYFYFLCVYLTKLAATFMLDLFTDIDVTKSMEAELYIVLVHVTIGLQVSAGSYEIYHRKVINEKIYNLRISNNNKPESTAETVVSKASSKRLNYIKRRNFKTVFDQHPPHFDCKEDQSTLDQFRETLRQNLNVKILPKLPKKKLKAEDFDSNTIKQTTQKQNDQNRYLSLTKPPQITKPRPSFLKSNQNSTSFQLLFHKTHQQTCFVHRDVKISHRPQLFVKQNSRQREMAVRTPTGTPHHWQEKSEENTARKNWEKIVKDIKYHTLHTNKFQEGSSRNQQQNTLELLKKNRRHLQIDAISNPKRSVTAATNEPQKREAKELFFAKRSKDFATYELVERQQPYESASLKPKQHRLNCDQLRIERQHFDLSCDKRSKETSYSMFNLMITPALQFKQ